MDVEKTSTPLLLDLEISRLATKILQSVFPETSIKSFLHLLLPWTASRNYVLPGELQERAISAESVMSVALEGCSIKQQIKFRPNSEPKQMSKNFYAPARGKSCAIGQ